MLKLFMEYTVDVDKMRKQDIRTDLPFLWSKLEPHVTYEGRMNE